MYESVRSDNGWPFSALPFAEPAPRSSDEVSRKADLFKD
jgi:hypothetical protein